MKLQLQKFRACSNSGKKCPVEQKLELAAEIVIVIMVVVAKPVAAVVHSIPECVIIIKCTAASALSYTYYSSNSNSSSSSTWMCLTEPFIKIAISRPAVTPDITKYVIKN